MEDMCVSGTSYVILYIWMYSIQTHEYSGKVCSDCHWPQQDTVLNWPCPWPDSGWRRREGKQARDSWVGSQQTVQRSSARLRAGSDRGREVCPDRRRHLLILPRQKRTQGGTEHPWRQCVQPGKLAEHHGESRRKATPLILPSQNLTGEHGEEARRRDQAET